MVAVGGLRLDEVEVRGLGAPAIAALSVGAWHCASELTDGVLTREAMTGLSIGAGARKRLVEAGLWREREDGTVEIVDYLTHNPSRAEVEARRGKATERMRRVRAHVRANRIPKTPPVRANTTPKTPPVRANERANSGAPPSGLPNTQGSSLISSPDPSSVVIASDPKDLPGSARVAKRMPKRPLPDDWEPKPRHVGAASKLGLDMGQQVALFRNNALGKDVRWVDWDRAFDNWLASPYAQPPRNGKAVGLIANENRELRPHEQARVERILRKVTLGGGG